MAAASARVATRTTIREATSDNAPHRRGEVLGVDAEELVDVGGGCRLAEAVDADHLAFEAHVLAPIIRGAGLDRHPRHSLWQPGFAPPGVPAGVGPGAKPRDHRRPG